MRKTAIGLAAAALLLTTSARAGDAPDATACVEIASDAARRGPAALLDQTWLDDLVVRCAWRDSVADAAKFAKLPDAPDFAGKTAADVADEFASALQVKRDDGPGLVRIRVGGAHGAAVANAVASWLQNSAKAEAKRRREDRKARLDESLAWADSVIRLGTLDRRNAMLGAGVSVGMLDVETERLLDDRRELGRASDELRRGLDLDEGDCAAFRAALSDPAKAVAALEGRARLVRDERLADLDEQLAAAREARDAALAAGFTKTSAQFLDADTAATKAESARARHVLRVARAFVTDVEDRRSRWMRLRKSLEDNEQQLVNLDALRERVRTINAEIERHAAAKAEIVAELEKSTQDAAGDDAVRILALAPTK